VFGFFDSRDHTSRSTSPNVRAAAHSGSRSIGRVGHHVYAGVAGGNDRQLRFVSTVKLAACVDDPYDLWLRRFVLGLEKGTGCAVRPVKIPVKNGWGFVHVGVCRRPVFPELREFLWSFPCGEISREVFSFRIILFCGFY
jgi:hypothetical protein